MMTTEQGKLLLGLEGVRDQIEKSHFLNAHFRAFKLAYECWQEHIRMNAVIWSRHANTPAGAVLDDYRDDVAATPPRDGEGENASGEGRA